MDVGRYSFLNGHKAVKLLKPVGYDMDSIVVGTANAAIASMSVWMICSSASQQGMPSAFRRPILILASIIVSNVLIFTTFIAIFGFI